MKFDSAAAAACLWGDSALFVRSDLFHRFLRPPLTRNLSPADPFPTHSKALGTGNALLWYGRDTRCAKQPPMVRDAFSEAFGVKNRLLRYGTDIRCQKQPSLVRDAFSKARRTAPATSNASPKARRTAPAAPNAFQRPAEQPTPQTADSLLWYAMRFQGPRCIKTTSCRTGRIFSARNGLREEAGKHKKRAYPKTFPRNTPSF